LDDLLEKGEALYANLPSAGLRGGLIGAHLSRASRQLRATHSTYEDVRKRSLRSVTEDYALLFAAAKDATLRAAAAEHPDVRRAVALVEEGQRLVPQRSSPWRWAILSQFKPAAAASMAALVEKNLVRRFDNTISWKMAPWNAQLALNRYWLHVLTGEAAKGEAVLKQVEANGVPLPRVPDSGK
jgi:hypothetical protein